MRGLLELVSRPWLLLAATVSSCLWGTGAWARDESFAAVLLAQAMVPEVSTTSLPRFDPDGAQRTSRVDMTWLSAQHSGLGLSLGMTSIDGLGLTLPGNLGNTGQLMDVGLRWRSTPDGNYQVDVTAWRRLTPPDAASLIQLHDSSYGARVEMRIGRAPTHAGLVAERGFVGFQLESGSRITLRRSDGKPMLYYRSNF